MAPRVLPGWADGPHARPGSAREELPGEAAQPQARPGPHARPGSAREEPAVPSPPAPPAKASGARPGVTPLVALKRDAAILTPAEREEILAYPSVWYTGLAGVKVADPSSGANGGYDDERGEYIVRARDHVAYRYGLMGELGVGSFGQVVKAVDHRTGGMVALKIIRNRARFYNQALVGVKVLRRLRAAERELPSTATSAAERELPSAATTVRYLHHFVFRGHLCIVFELLSLNLYQLLKANAFRGVSLALVRRFGEQLLSALVLLRRERIVHCDLKPENVLLCHPAKSAIKVIDFGSSCFEQHRMYTYIQSRFYRAPEVLLGLAYGTPIDVWSAACILAELASGHPIFPGENEKEQFACIAEVLGPPPVRLVDESSRTKVFFDAHGAVRPVTNSKGRVRAAGARTLADAARVSDTAFLDFLGACLCWEAERRPTPEQLLRHPFITGEADPNDVVSAAALSERAPAQQLLTQQPQPPPQPQQPSQQQPQLSSASPAGPAPTHVRSHGRRLRVPENGTARAHAAVPQPPAGPAPAPPPQPALAWAAEGTPAEPPQLQLWPSPDGAASGRPAHAPRAPPSSEPLRPAQPTQPPLGTRLSLPLASIDKYGVLQTHRAAAAGEHSHASGAQTHRAAAAGENSHARGAQTHRDGGRGSRAASDQPSAGSSTQGSFTQRAQRPAQQLHSALAAAEIDLIDLNASASSWGRGDSALAEAEEPRPGEPQPPSAMSCRSGAGSSARREPAPAGVASRRLAAASWMEQQQHWHRLHRSSEPRPPPGPATAAAIAARRNERSYSGAPTGLDTDPAHGPRSPYAAGRARRIPAPLRDARRHHATK